MTIWVGVMSGTSLDGVDVAIVDFPGDQALPTDWKLLGFHTEPHDPEMRARIRAAIETGSAEALCDLDFLLGEDIAKAVLTGLERASIGSNQVRAIGSHGQTVWHRPPEGDRRGATLQLGQPAVIAERTGLPVVADFRVRDMAARGEGAPLTAYTDHILLKGDDTRAIQNIGGMANVTVIPGEASEARPQAFDTGPGVALLDAAVEVMTEGVRTFDRDGELAAAGSVAESALEAWLDDPFFERPPPRSTGRERFSEARLRAWLAEHDGLSVEDVAATLSELTARTICEAYRWIESDLAVCFVCGGGARNPAIVERVAQRLAPLPVRDLSDLGVDPDAREAVAFALLARQHHLGIPANAPWATGASGPRILGAWTPA